jgi:hypothetical protein
MKEILYGTAFDTNGILTKAVDASKEIKYRCTHCQNIVKLKKSEKWLKGEKKSKRPHFSHLALSPNCSPESVLHFGFKTILFNKIKSKIEVKDVYPIRWECTMCFNQHTIDILRKADDVRLEFPLNFCKPDILLFSKGKPILAIEIVVTHKPESKVLLYYKDNSIAVLTIELTSDQDLNLIDEPILFPTSVSECPNPVCEICGKRKQNKTLLVSPVKCWKCSSIMKATILKFCNQYLGPSRFSSTEIEMAKSKGVSLKMSHTNKSNKKYLANICNSCNNFIGEPYLLKMDFNELANIQGYQEFHAGFECEYCIMNLPQEKANVIHTLSFEKIHEIQEDIKRKNELEEIEYANRQKELHRKVDEGLNTIKFQNDLVVCPINKFNLDKLKSSPEFLTNSTCQIIQENYKKWDEKISYTGNGKPYVDFRTKGHLLEGEETIYLIKKWVELATENNIAIKSCKKCQHHRGILHNHILCSFLKDNK